MLGTARGRALMVGLLAAAGAIACGGPAPTASTSTGTSAQALGGSNYHATNGAALKDRAGNPIASGSTTPYSPERTCGGCHDVSVVTQGYHFQQGKGLSNTSIYVSDTYNPAKPWLLSDGMYGKW